MSTRLRSYFNEKAPVWDELIAEKDTAKLERMAEWLRLKPGSAVLDVGTGTGVFVPFMMSRIGGGGRLVALDIAEEMLKLARAKKSGETTDHVQADVLRLPFHGEAFDTVVCYSSFPHFQDKSKALKEVRRVLKPGGRVFVCHTSCRNAINEIHRSIQAVANDLVPDPAAMESMLAETGFTDVLVKEDSDSYLASARKATWS
jgi:ubiquinone/menaquinone biosynthesis C-methylase UbiE